MLLESSSDARRCRRGARGHREGARLRHQQGGRQRAHAPHAHRHHHGNAELHVARAGARQAGRPPRRHLLDRRRPLLRAHRQAAVRLRRPDVDDSRWSSTQDPPRPRSLDPRIPEALELIVQKAMAKEARDRYQTMGELAKALAAFEDGGRSMVHVPAVERRAARAPGRAAPNARSTSRSGCSPASARPGQSASLARVARPTIIVASAVLGTLARRRNDGRARGARARPARRRDHADRVRAARRRLSVRRGHARRALRAPREEGHLAEQRARAPARERPRSARAAAALVTYGGLSIVARIGHTVLWRSSKGLASGWWDIALFLVSVIAAVTVGGFAPLVRNMRRRRSA